jgi:hypothetical protein
MSAAFILGNGESRKSVDLDDLKTKGVVYGCNALFRDFTPDALICVDGGMMHEVYANGYASKNKCYFRSWSKLPGEMYDMLVEGTIFDSGGYTIENPKQGRKEFVLNGTDPNQMRQLYEYHVNKGSDKRTIDELLSKHHRWITWVDENDEVHLIPEEYGGWSAGPIAVRLAIQNHNPLDAFLIGFDLGSKTGTINNLYKGTDNYLSDSAAVTPSVNWIEQHKQNFLDYPEVRFWKVNPAPLGTDNTCQFVEEWESIENLQYIEIENLDLSLDFGWMM